MMPDREKVISELKSALEWCDPEDNPNGSIAVKIWAVGEAVELLKEQEAVRPERQHSGGGTTWWNICGNCRTAINPNDKFCHECGKTVKWE